MYGFLGSFQKMAYSDLKSFLVDDPTIESISDTLFNWDMKIIF